MGALWQTDSSKTVVPTESVDQAPVPEKPRRPRHGWKAFWLLLLIIAIVVGMAAAKEMRTSRFQSSELSKYAASLTYKLEPGPSEAIHYPGNGPFDLRLGYSSLDEFLPRLLKRNYVITEQTRFSPPCSATPARGCSCPIRKRSRPA